MAIKDTNILTNIENINIFQNISDSRYSSCIIIFKNQEEKPFLLYIEKLDKQINISNITEEYYSFYVRPRREFILTTKLSPIQDDSIYRIIDLSFKSETKEMTKEQIESVLGYKIKIV